MQVIEQHRVRYKELLREYAEEEKPEPIPNRFPWHCALAVPEILAFAKKSAKVRERKGEVERKPILVITGTFPKKIYGRNCEDSVFLECLKAGLEVKVLVWNDELTKERTKALNELAAEFVNFQYRISRTDVDTGKIPHFLVADSRAYRLERPHDEFPITTEFTDTYPPVPSRICFNDHEGAVLLENYFGKLWELVEPQL